VAVENEAAAGGAAGKPKSSKKLLLFVIAPLLVLLLAGGGAYFFLAGKKDEAAEQAEPPPPPKPSVFYKLPDMLVTLGTVNGRASFLKITVSLELESDEDVRRVQSVMPRVVDAMYVYLRELRIEDLRGVTALNRLRAELLARVNMTVQPTHVTDVLLQEVLVQ
jgi:flagellar FliL protein